MLFKIELKYAHGWDDARWTDEIDGVTTPTRFATLGEAQAGLSDFHAEVNAALASGDMQFGYDPSDFRIVPAAT